MDAAQTLGLIKGITLVVQEQSNAMKATSDQIQHLAITVENLTKIQQTPVPSSQSPGLCLPNLVLREYTGKEPLDRFLRQIESLLVSSAVPTKHWITYLKQQCQKDARAYDALNSAHQAHLHLLGPDLSKTADAEFKQHFDQCVKTLREKTGNRGISKFASCWRPKGG